ncbi:hypothetical protein [Actinophytocola algeriensis]|uniref:Uncharacterized protein n=1 Tax=Actinophytocola algeriensis TaxID=1768010 RepID=A0A7W7VFK9_9PSEU|nr:hypothetical protein [Actinophytocola algeriensis]MBB4908249.1 hypothetical protein [Actinophytocola algeriensis]MBE1480279.1 hypothetical protein [Actinophytocola algeriensis]
MARPRREPVDPGLLARFLHALRRTPIPSAPSPHDSYQEALGLNLLALGLRLEHVDRMSETLTLADSTHMARTVSIDINMNVLTADQKWALRTDPGADSPDSVWLPVARHSRTAQASFVVRDSAGNVVPRTTQVETARALIHGLCRAFRMFLTSDPRTEDREELLHGIKHTLNRSRWLIEATIAAMVTGGRPRLGALPPSPPDNVRPTDSDIIREKAATAVTQLFEPDSPFLRLLDIASSEYLLVVAMPAQRAQTFIRYDAPVIPALSKHLRPRNTFARWVGVRHEFTVRYTTLIPRAVNSYHVTAEVPQEIQVRRFFLTTDVDSPALRSLVADMRAVADSYDNLRAVAPKLLELELQGIASRLAEFGRRRERDLAEFRAYIEERYATFSSRPPRFPPRPDTTTPAEDTGLGLEQPIIAKLERFANLYEADWFRKLADGPMTRDTLLRLADELEETQVDQDVHTDNDPRENAGHAQWQRRPFGADPRPVEPVTSTVYMALVDDPPSLASNVAKLLLAVLVLVVSFGVVLEPAYFAGVPVLGSAGESFHPVVDDGGPISSADAIVTMLLLVPGLLLSRLEIPSNKTVLGQLRLFPRYVAYSSVIIAGALALLVASGRSGSLRVPFLLGMLALLVLFLFVGLDGLGKAVKRRRRVPVNKVSPTWLVDEIRGRRVRRWKRCRAEFTTIGTENDSEGDHA